MLEKAVLPVPIIIRPGAMAVIQPFMESRQKEVVAEQVIMPLREIVVVVVVARFGMVLLVLIMIRILMEIMVEPLLIPQVKIMVPVVEEQTVQVLQMAMAVLENQIVLQEQQYFMLQVVAVAEIKEQIGVAQEVQV